MPTETGAGQETVGACVSLTVTVKEHDGPLAVEQFTVVVPIGKNEPEAGTQVTVPHDPVVVGVWKFTEAPHIPASFGATAFAGHVSGHPSVRMSASSACPPRRRHGP